MALGKVTQLSQCARLLVRQQRRCYSGAVTAPSAATATSPETVHASSSVSIASMLTGAPQTASSHDGRAGLCDIPWLHRNADFGKASTAARDVCIALVQELEADTSSGLHTLQRLDCISDALCKVLDCAEFVRQNHANDNWKSSAQRAYGELATLRHALNAHKPLHSALCAITTSPSAMNRLSEGQQRMAVLLQAEFERDGIHLPDEPRHKLIALNDAVNAASNEFQTRITGGEKVVEAPVAEIQPHVSADTFARCALSVRPGIALVPTDSTVIHEVLQNVSSDGVRRDVLIARDTENSGNGERDGCCRGCRTLQHCRRNDGDGVVTRRVFRVCSI